MRANSSSSDSPPDGRRRLLGALAALVLAGQAAPARAGTQAYEPLADAVRSALAARIADPAPRRRNFDDPRARIEFIDWLAEMSARLATRQPAFPARVELLRVLDYEATRAGLDRQMVLGLIQVESNFRKYAISPAGARGLMQVMPFWTQLIGDGDTRALFDLRTNLRYGCVILRHYLDREQGDLFRALGRYNGTLGRPEYPNAVRTAWLSFWSYAPGGVRHRD